MAANKSRGQCDSGFWTKEKTLQLISLFESCSDLWNVSSQLYGNRNHKQMLQAEIGAKMGIDDSQVSAKLHNLRCQYNGELRKLKAKKSDSGTDKLYVPRWEFFKALQFLSINARQSCSTTSKLIYRQNPCLWKVKDIAYSNKVIKDDAYSKLLDLYRTVVPTATVDTVKRKINNLRCAFRKELRKVKASKSADDCYTPSLWYYGLLMFLTGQEESRNYDLSMTASEADEGWSSLPLTSPPESTFSASASKPHCSVSSAVTKKRHRKAPKRRGQSSIIKTLKALKQEDEFDGIGVNVACKLRRMDEEQKMYAELLLNKLLINGLKGRLQEDTDITGLLVMQPPLKIPRCGTAVYLPAQTVMTPTTSDLSALQTQISDPFSSL